MFSFKESIKMTAVAIKFHFALVITHGILQMGVAREHEEPELYIVHRMAENILFRYCMSC